MLSATQRENIKELLNWSKGKAVNSNRAEMYRKRFCLPQPQMQRSKTN